MNQSTVEQGQALASVIEYITGWSHIDVERIEKDHIVYTFNGAEYTMSIKALSDGKSRIYSEMAKVFELVGV